MIAITWSLVDVGSLCGVHARCLMVPFSEDLAMKSSELKLSKVSSSLNMKILTTLLRLLVMKRRKNSNAESQEI